MARLILTPTFQNRTIEVVGGPLALPMQAVLRGQSAYELAVDNGFEGTQEEWLAALAASGQWADIEGKPDTFPPSDHGHAIGEVAGLQAAIDEALSGWDKTTNTISVRKVTAPEANKGYLNLASDGTVTLGNSTGERIAFTGGYPVWLKQGEGQLALGASNSLTIGADSDGVLGVKGNNFEGYCDVKLRALIMPQHTDGGVTTGPGLYFGSHATNRASIHGFNSSIYHRVDGAVAAMTQYAFGGGGAALLWQFDGTIGVLGFSYGNVPNGGPDAAIGANATGRLEINNGRTTGTGGALRDLKARTYFGESPAYNEPAFRVMSGASYLGGLGSNGSSVQLRHEATGNLLGIGNIAQVDAKGLKVVAGTATTLQPALEITQTWNNAAVTQDAFIIDVTSTAAGNTSNVFNFKKGGTTILRLDQWGALYPAANGAGVVGYQLDSTGMVLKTQNGITWTSGSSAQGSRHVGLFPSDWVTGQLDVTAGGDIRWSNGQYRDVALRTLLSYNQLTNLTNYERAKFGWNSNTLEIGVQAAGTGTAREIDFLVPNGLNIVATAGQTAFRFHPNAGYATFGKINTNFLEIGSDSWRGLSRIINLTSTSGISWSNNTSVSGTASLGLSQEGTSGKLAVTDGASSPSYRDIVFRGLQFGSMVTVGTLPSASTSEGLMYRVSDALAPTVGATVAAGGSSKAVVLASSSAWVVVIVG